MNNNFTKFILFVVLFLTSALLLFRITHVPPGVNGDEIGIARNAYLMSNNLTDENGNYLPLFIFAKDSDWKQPVTVYATALVFKLFGPSLLTLRFTSVAFVLVSILIIFYISKLKNSLSFFLVSSLVFVTTPIIMLQSHLALENIALLPFVFAWMLALLMHEKTKRNFWVVAAGLVLGVGIFAYLGMRAGSLVLTALTVYYLRYDKKAILYFILSVMPFWILLYVSTYFYPRAIVGRYSAPPPTLSDFLYRYLSVFDLSFLFIKGDAVSYHSTGKAGMFLVATLPAFLIGIYQIIKNPKSFDTLILLAFFATPLFFGFVPDVHRASRLLVLVPFFVFITTIGINYLTKSIKYVLIALIALNFVYFSYDYWTFYPERVKDDFRLTIDNYNNDFTKK